MTPNGCVEHDGCVYWRKDPIINTPLLNEAQLQLVLAKEEANVDILAMKLGRLRGLRFAASVYETSSETAIWDIQNEVTELYFAARKL
jgi:hypothetical protein